MSNYSQPSPEQQPNRPEYVIGYPAPQLPPPAKKSHKYRNTVLALTGALVAAIIIGTATSNDQPPTHNHAAMIPTEQTSSTPTEAPSSEAPSTEAPSSEAPSTEAPTPHAQPSPSTVSDNATKYAIYSGVMQDAGYPVFIRSRVETMSVTFCDPSLTSADIQSGLLTAIADDAVDPHQLAYELGAIVQLYCPARLPVFNAATS